MKKLDIFILKSFIGPFFAILFVVIFILMMQFLWLYIDELVGKGLSMKVILEFLGWGCATLLPLSLPLATLLSSMMTLGTMGENNELLAIKAAGISLKRVLTPLMIASFIISVGTFFATNDLVPVAYNKIFTLRDDIGRTKEEIKIPTGTFYDGIDGYVLRVNERNDDSGMMYDVMVYNHSGNNRGNTSLTLADSALMNMSKDKSYLTFTLYSGANYEETNTRKYRDTTYQLQKIEFERQDLVISLENYAFQKSDEARFGDEVKSMNLKQLTHGRDSIGGLNADTRAEQLKKLMSGSTLLFGRQLDTSRKSGISRPFVCEEMGKWDTIGEEMRAYERAISQINEYVSTLTTFGRETFYHTYTLRRIDVEMLKKFAVAVACFIFFFIGAPLGALIRKGGLGTPAIISVLFFVAYWVIDISGTKLANDGAVSAAAGVFISSVVLFPIGIFLTWKAINDSSIFSVDSMKTWFKKVKMKIMGTTRRTRIVYMGTPEFAVAPLKELIDKKYNVVGVVTVADKASGRGLKVNESAVKRFALGRGLPILQPASLKDPGFIASLKAWKPDLIVVVAFRMLPREVWEIPRLGTFNLHAALLPQYRGAAPINWAIINGEHMSGVTTFMIDDGMDTGKVIFREQCRIEDEDNAGDLHDKLMDLGAKVVVQTVETILEGNLELRFQKEFIQGDEVLKPAPKLTRELCRIKWDGKTRDIHNLIRGLSPYPGAFTQLVSEDGRQIQMKIFASEKTDAATLRAKLAESGRKMPESGAGTLLSDGREWLAFTTADGAVSVTELQISGKRRMHVKEFLAGFRDPETWKVCTEEAAQEAE